MVALVVALAAWRTAATAFERVAHAAGSPPSDRVKWATTAFSDRLRSTIGADVEYVELLQKHVPHGGIVLVFGTQVAGEPSIRDRLTLLRMRLQSLLYPLSVLVGVGPIADPAQYESLLSRDMWLLNLTPDVDRPLAKDFERVVGAHGYELSRYVGSRP